MVLFTIQTNAQRLEIVKDRVGKPCPDIRFTKLVNAKQNEVKISDYKGKIIILDFWATWCGPCVSALPKLNKLQEKFKDDVQVILISSEDQSNVVKFFEKVKKNWAISMFSATEDTLANKTFRHPTIPFTVIIDREGIVHSIPFSEEITEENIARIISGNKVNLKQDSVLFLRTRANMRKPLLTDSKYGTKRLYYSMLGSYNPLYSGVLSIKSDVDSLDGGKITLLNTTIPTLYAAAFGGFKEKNSPYTYFIPYTQIDVQSKDSAMMYPPKDKSKMRQWSEQNLFSYEYIFPKSHVDKAYEYFKEDLNRFFGYDVKIEKRKVECFLIKKANDRYVSLNTKGGKTFFYSDAYSLKMTNAPMGQLVHWLEHKYLSLYRLPVLDESGLTDNIDLNLEVKLTDVTKLSEALREHGLYIDKGIREVGYLVIADRKESKNHN